MTYTFEKIGRLPAPGDNVAIAIQTLDAGTTITFGAETWQLSHTVLAGHRFAVQPIATGENLLSWGQTFGVALKTIAPGNYVCNAAVLNELSHRTLDFALPEHPNFADQIAPFSFDETTFQPAPPLPLYEHSRTFAGYRRSGGRGVGTRNMIVLLGTSSFTGGFVRLLETRLKPLAEKYPNIDGIVAVAHTEGGHDRLNNRELLLRTLAGFMVNPNAGAVLAVDYGSEAMNNAALQAYMQQHDYPLNHLLHQFMTISGSFEQSLDTAAHIVDGWLHAVNAISRTPESVKHLKIGLQCGGSDAFSGISANPLLGLITKEILQHGGAANLAETDELIGAETYMLHNVRDAATAKKFLATLNRFKTWAGWHGQAAEGNPSGGNMYRGLYNIYLKSLGAAMKRDPRIRLDYVIEYGEPMPEAGFYFMDSPGNDLESIAGQIACGCNLIFFTTGNGSITNFPFVPTLKIVTTTERYHLLEREMDINAGAYLDGTPLETLAEAAFELTLAAASGQRVAGERAGHSQVQIWRDWQQTRTIALDAIPVLMHYSGDPVQISLGENTEKTDFHYPVVHNRYGTASERVALILPTSLCSGQIARMCAAQLNEQGSGQAIGIARFVALVHTEGCGSSTVTELTDTMLGYLQHPVVHHALLLEHGCEKTHNSYFRHVMSERGLDSTQFGWASVQLDGGIQNVLHKMTTWFETQFAIDTLPNSTTAGLNTLRLGLLTDGAIANTMAEHLARLTQQIVAAGGTVVTPMNDALLQNSLYQRQLKLNDPLPTLGYAQPFAKAGLHLMAAPTQNTAEIMTGLGATGVDMLLVHISKRPLPGNPLLPVLQITGDEAVAKHHAADLDAVFSADASVEMMLTLLEKTLQKNYSPRSAQLGNMDFQVTRGLLGISL